MVTELTPIAAGEWNAEKAAHLLARAGFGGTPEDIARLAAMTLVWARTVQVGAGKQRGLSVLPEVGDEVLVAFDRGSKGPHHKGWNLRDNCIDSAAQTEPRSASAEMNPDAHIAEYDSTGCAVFPDSHPF